MSNAFKRRVGLTLTTCFFLWKVSGIINIMLIKYIMQIKELFIISESNDTDWILPCLNKIELYFVI